MMMRMKLPQFLIGLKSNPMNIVINTTPQYVKLDIDGLVYYTGSKPVIVPNSPSINQVNIQAKEYDVHVSFLDAYTIDGVAFVPANLNALVEKLYVVFQTVNSGSGSGSGTVEFQFTDEEAIILREIIGSFTTSS